MPGGSSRLALQGYQDKFLHHLAYHSYFTSSHVTYENFAIESMNVTAQGQIAFTRNAQFTLPAQAELISGAALSVTLPTLTAPIIGGVQYNIAWCHSIGFYIYTKIEMKAQAQILDTRYPEYADAWSRFTITLSKRDGFNDLMGQVNVNTVVGNNGSIIAPDITQYPQFPTRTKNQINLLIPLDFWWCQDYTQAIPIGILLFTTLRISVFFNDVQKLYVLNIEGGTYNNAGFLASQPQLVDASLWVDYVFLDEAARNRLARDAHFFVFKQTQNNGGVASVSSPSYSAKLQFVLPVTHIMTFVRESLAIANGVNGPQRWGWFDKFDQNTSYVPRSPFSQIEIRINAQRTQEARDYLYHARYQPLKAHTSIPQSRGIWMEAFALYPEEADASGDCNFSRAENNSINYVFDTQGTYNTGFVAYTTPSGVGVAGAGGDLFIFATNLNYIFIESGFLTMLYNA